MTIKKPKKIVQKRRSLKKPHQQIEKPNVEKDIQVKETKYFKKPKDNIDLPGWRRVEIPSKLKLSEEIEDLSDEAFIRRHCDAELEEQRLWDHWRKIREEQGKKITGRSTSSGWRVADLGVGAPRLRSQRRDSQESSSSGCLSSVEIEKIKEICIFSFAPDRVSVKSPNESNSASESLNKDSVVTSDIKNNFSVSGDSVRRVRRSIVTKVETDLFSHAKENLCDARNSNNTTNLQSSVSNSDTVLRESNSLKTRRYN